MEALSSLEFLVQAALFVAAGVVAATSVVRARHTSLPGEAVWSAVAIVVLVSALAAATLGGARGG